jgi:predicted  nucleic acid-binding Zn-ribbon protein
MSVEDSAAYRDLARELYWAQERASRARLDTPEIRDRLHDLAAQLRADEKVIIPHGEGNLASPSRWRRQMKFGIFRVMRPISWRYDRLIADHAELTTSLAERLMAAEAELERLRTRVDGADAPEDPAP